MKVSGVYIIINIITNKYYIGSSTKSIYRRLQHHKASLIRGNHHNSHLQKAFNKYGVENFIFDILEEHPSDICKYMEQYWINMLSSANSIFGYNMCSVANNTFGTKRTPQQCLNISNSLKGKLSGSKHPLYGTKRNPTFEKKCCKMDINTKEIVKEYKSIKEAAEDTGVDNTSISKACCGKTKVCKGYIWKYLN